MNSWQKDPGIVELVEYFNQQDVIAGGWPRLASKPNELKVVSQEIIRCRENFRYAARNYFHIQTKDRRIIPFNLWESQELLLEKVESIKAKQRAQKVLILKARQLGFSTLIEALLAWRVMYFQNVSAIIVSHAPHHSVSLFDKMCLIYDMLPWWMQPMCLSRKIEEGLKFDNPEHETRSFMPGLKSSVVVQSANQTTGVGQGYTIQAAHLCLTPDSMIRIGQGGYKRIVEISPSDKVLTSCGRMANVKAIWKSDRGPEETSEIGIWSNPFRLRLTKDHPVLTEYGYKEASSIKIGDWVRYPVRKISKEIVEFEVINNATGGVRCGRDARIRKEVHPMNYEWGWFFGLYVAEGSLGWNRRLKTEYQACRISIAIHQEEVPEVMAGLEKCFPDRKLTAKYRTTSKTATIEINHSGLARYIDRTFGHTDSKTIPDWVWNGGEEFCRGIVSGYLFGDGHVAADRAIYATSVRPAITMQLRDLVASLGFGWSSICHRDAGLHYGRNCKEAWTWILCSTVAVDVARLLGKEISPPLYQSGSGSYRPHWRYSEDKGFVELEVDDVQVGTCNEFYDLEVDAEEHSFTTFQFCVKNSETADWEDTAAKQIIEGDLAYALAEGPETFAFIETTAKGEGRYFHRLWQKAEELGDDSEWYPFFVPWFFERNRKVIDLGHNFRIEDPELKIREKVFQQWLCCAECGKFREAVDSRGVQLEGDSCPVCLTGKLEPYRLTDNQLGWIAIKRKNSSKDLETLKEYHQELPTTAAEAFVLEGVQVFPIDALQFAEDCIETHKPIAKGFMDNTGVFHGVSYENGGRCPSRECDVDHQYDDMPLTVWEYPQPGCSYTIGVDVANGDGGQGDYSVAFVNKVSDGFGPDEHVATMRSNEIDPISFAFPTAFLGMWYNEALMSIECNKFDTCFSYVRNQMQYPNLYRWKHVDSTNPNSNKWGWWTNQTSRPRLYQTAIKLLKSKLWVVKSPNILREMKHFQKDDYEDRRVEHSLGEYDDELIAGMISLYCSHDSDYDNNLGFIPVRMSRSTAVLPYAMHCMTCNFYWGASDPTVQCPQCGSPVTRGSKNIIPDFSANREWTNLASGSEDEPQQELDFEHM